MIDSIVGAYGRSIPTIMIGAAGSLIAQAVLLILERRFGKPKRSKMMVTSTVVVAGGLMFASMVIGFDIHHLIPKLDYATLEDAQALLSEQSVDSVVIPEERNDIELGIVVPNSQSLSPGQLVGSGTSMTFGITDQGTNTINYPKTNGQADCTRTSGGFCTINVDGLASALVSNRRLRLLLWAKSRESDWYLQRPIFLQTARTSPDQIWTGEAQVGNSQYPPLEGETIDLALTVASNSERIPPHEPDGRQVSAVQRVSISIIGGK